jgi:hypothetical protein
VGRPSTGQRSASPGLGRPASHCRRCQGKAISGFQWGRLEPGCSSDTTPSDAGTIHHRGRRIQGELKNLLEDDAVRRAESSVSRRQGFPTRFRTPTTITKYSGESKPELWLADYRLAYQLGGTDDDNLIIRNLPRFLSDAARAWLEHLPPMQISNWDDLIKAFVGDFQGTYVRPGNSWDLRSCR